MKRLAASLAFAALLFTGVAAAQAEPQLELRLAPGGNTGQVPKLGFNGWYICHQSHAPDGMWVESVFRHTTASRIGLERGDVILEINGRRIRSNRDYQDALVHAKYRNGGLVRMLVDDVRHRYSAYQGRQTELVFYLP